MATPEVDHSKGEFISCISSGKKNGSYRPIINLNNLNEFVHQQNFQRGLHVINQLKGCISLFTNKQGFSEIAEVSIGKKLARVSFPLLWTAVSVLRRLIIRVIIFLNNLLISDNTMEEMFMAWYLMNFHLQHLGFVINFNFKRWVLEPTQEIILPSLPSEGVKKENECLKVYCAQDIIL